MQRMFFTAFISFLQIISVIFPGNTFVKAPSLDTGIIDVSEIPRVTSAHNDSRVRLKAKSALIYDCKNNEIVFARNTDEAIAPASLTKLVTALTALEYITPETVLPVGTEIKLRDPDASVAFLRVGNRINFRNLMYGLLLPSGCDAAYTIAVNTARQATGMENLSDKVAVECFVAMMNKYAEKIGMKNSHFVNPEGFDNFWQTVTAEDMLKLAATAYNNSVIRETVGVHKKYIVFESGREVVWYGTNAMLDPDNYYYNEHIKGLKTGSSDSAGKSFVGVYDDSEHFYITVVLGCEEYYQRYSDTNTLIRYAKNKAK